MLFDTDVLIWVLRGGWESGTNTSFVAPFHLRTASFTIV